MDTLLYVLSFLGGTSGLGTSVKVALLFGSGEEWGSVCGRLSGDDTEALVRGPMLMYR